MVLNAQLDHLVVLAITLDEGVRWAEQNLGVTPGPGGEHPLMGTHNRLLHIAGPDFERAYLEIIAINPAAAPQRAAGLKRWFDMDDAALQERVLRDGPALIHAVFRVNDLDTAVAALAAQSLDAGRVISASRPTAQGLLQWRITVRDDGRRLFDGCLPTLIQWGADDATGVDGVDSAATCAPHPTDHLPPSGLQLAGLRVRHPQAQALRAALTALGWSGPVETCAAGEAGWQVRWDKTAVNQP